MDVIKNILGAPRKRGGRRDLDGDGVSNKKDCQPRNTMRQDEDDNVLGYTKTGAVVKIVSVNNFRENAFFVYGKPGSMGKLVSKQNLNEIVVKKVNPHLWIRLRLDLD